MAKFNITIEETVVNTYRSTPVEANGSYEAVREVMKQLEEGKITLQGKPIKTFEIHTIHVDITQD